MGQMEVLRDLILIFSSSAFVVFAFERLRIPAIVGFLVAGVALGPHGLSLVRDLKVVEDLADIGVVLLLFTVGLEFSMSRMYRMRKMVVAGGSIQVLLTILLVAVLAWFGTGDLRKSVFIGFLAALSSTAVVLKALIDLAESNTQQGEIITGILVFQDLCAVPMMLMVPFLAGHQGAGEGLLALIVKAVFLIAMVFAATRWVVPHLLYHTVNTRNRELFIIVVLLMCLGTAYITFEAGLSLALGAFLAGIMIADSEYSHQVIGEILPFRDIFNSLFFVSIGMLMDLRYAFNNLPMVLTATLCIFLLKFPVAAIPPLVFRFPLRFGIGTGIALSQIGEFSFVLAKSAKASGMILGEMYQTFLAAAIITMAATPFMMSRMHVISTVLLRRMPRRRFERSAGTTTRYKPVKDHVIILGFGLNGRHLAAVLKATGVPYNILDMNPATVRDYIRKGEPIHYGDGTREHVLRHVKIDRARVLVVAASDPTAERSIVSLARRLNPNLHITVRTRYVKEIEPLMALGANEVIPEEFETSVEIFAHVLKTYNVPSNIIMDQINKIRRSSYEMFRGTPKGLMESPLSAILSHKVGVQTVEVPAESRVAGKRIGETDIRARTGSSILAVQRNSDFTANPPPSMVLLPNDMLYLVGDARQIEEATDFIKGKVEDSPHGGNSA